eukprot:m.351531 g.351531  ORF g.351531 m.351531 type:complete len:95 (+) comp16270_c0_seq1:3064-3348(+)
MPMNRKLSLFGDCKMEARQEQQQRTMESAAVLHLLFDSPAISLAQMHVDAEAGTDTPFPSPFLRVRRQRTASTSSMSSVSSSGAPSREGTPAPL